MVFNRRETPVAMVNLISLIKFSENEHFIWGQNRTTEMNGKFHTFTGYVANEITKEF